jgi:hypothetical protein
MEMKKGFLAALLGSAALIVASAAHAQTVVPQVQSLNQNDLVHVIPHGAPSTGNVYAPTGAVGGQELYSYQVPLTGFAITVPAHTSLLYFNPAGTLATGALTMEANPSDGQRLCLEDTQTQTAMTVAANTGQSMLTSIGLGAVTALTANTPVCWYYNAPLSGWIRTK